MGTLHYITQVNFDFGALATLPSECARIGIRRPLVVSDRGVVAAGIVAQALATMTLPTAVFDGTPSNPTESAVLAALEHYRAHAADGVIAVGGGSSLDLGKAVALLATHPLPLAQYATILGGSSRITAAVAPLIAVPTTAGTGSEVARGAIIVLDDGRKLGFHSWHLVPRVSIADPELTVGLPPLLTAATGMDAIAHCIETFLSKADNPPADAIALDGLYRGVSSIEAAVRDGSDRAARRNMMSASMQGAMAFQKGLGAVHSLSHALGGLKINPHHGTLNAVLLPEVVRFNAVEVPERVERVAQVFGTTAQRLPDAIRSLNERLKLPAGLAAMRIDADVFDAMAERALHDHCHATNPRPVSRDDYLGLLARSL
jgi:4-hydroxybutyrate dehydrogenase